LLSALFFEESIEKMAGDSTSMVKSMNPHPLKIDVVKFDGKKNFEMWKCEVIEALTTSNLKDTLRLEKKRETVGPKVTLSVYAF